VWGVGDHVLRDAVYRVSPGQSLCWLLAISAQQRLFGYLSTIAWCNTRSATEDTRRGLHRWWKKADIPSPSTPEGKALWWRGARAGPMATSHRSHLARIPLEKLFSGEDIPVYHEKSSSSNQQPKDPFDTLLLLGTLERDGLCSGLTPLTTCSHVAPIDVA